MLPRGAVILIQAHTSSGSRFMLAVKGRLSAAVRTNTCMLHTLFLSKCTNPIHLISTHCEAYSGVNKVWQFQVAVTRYSLLFKRSAPFADWSARPAGFAESAHRDWSLAYLVSHSNLRAVTWICVAASFISTEMLKCVWLSVSRKERQPWCRWHRWDTCRASVESAAWR